MVAAHRHAHRGDAGGGEYDFGLRAPLFHRLHGRGPVPAALLRLSVDLHVLHADAGDGRQSGADVFRLGGRGPRELSVDRLLVSQAGSQRCGDQGLRGQPGRRFRLRARHLRLVRAGRRDRFRHRLCPGAVADRQDHVVLRLAPRCAHADLPAAVHGRHGQVGAVPAAHLAARRHGRPNPGFRADPRRHHGDGGRVMVARLSPLFELAPNAQSFVIFIGATTAIFAATVGLVQNDIKRIIAYSTCSQLGYMFVAMGCGAYSVGMFHLFTHAFFKALLFLGSGAVILAMHHEQDIRHMGGLKDRIPYTYWLMVIGTLALTGFPLTAGYFSKDAIIEAAYVAKSPMALYGFICTVAAALLTSFYSWRLIFKTFHGEPHDRKHWKDAHESPMVMLIPLGFLAFGSIMAGLPFKEIFAGHGVEGFFRESLAFAKGNSVLEDMHHVPLTIGILPTVMMAIGFVIAWHFYIRRPDIPVELARQHEVLYKFLLN